MFKLKSCNDCCRYEHCKKNEPMPMIHEEGMVRLGMAIVGEIAVAYEEAYKRGRLYTKTFYERALRNYRTNILTAELYDGTALADNLIIRCQEKYGDFDTIYKKEQEKLNIRINELEKKLRVAETNRERGLLKKKINHLKGEKSL